MGKGGQNVHRHVQNLQVLQIPEYDKEYVEPQGENEILINGRYYNIQNFKHPGGSVLRWYAGNGIDASDPFKQIHFRSKKAWKVLDCLPSRKANLSPSQINPLDGQVDMLNDYHILEEKLTLEGYFKPDMKFIIYRITELLILMGVGCMLMYYKQVWTGAVVFSLFSGRAGWLLHESGHNSITGNMFMDKMIRSVFYGFGCGLSASWWCNQHNKHHSMPQKEDHDVDLNTLPLICFDASVAKDKKLGYFTKLWIRFQAYLFPLVISTVSVFMWQFIVHPRYILRTKNILEGGLILFRYICISLLIPHIGWKQTLLAILLYTWVGGNYIFINLALFHTHMPVLSKEDTSYDWVRFAAYGSINVNPGMFSWVNWWISYQNFHIEHHLFPSMPQHHFPAISPRVKALFNKHNIPYVSLPYHEAMVLVFKNLNDVGKEVFFKF